MECASNSNMIDQEVTKCKYPIRTDINRDGTEIVALFYLQCSGSVMKSWDQKKLIELCCVSEIVFLSQFYFYLYPFSTPPCNKGLGFQLLLL